MAHGSTSTIKVSNWLSNYNVHEKISTILLSVILRYNAGLLEKDRRYHVAKFEPVSLLLYICSSVHKAPFHYETLTNERPFGMGLKVQETLEFNP